MEGRRRPGLDPAIVELSDIVKGKNIYKERRSNRVRASCISHKIELLAISIEVEFFGKDCYTL